MSHLCIATLVVYKQNVKSKEEWKNPDYRQDSLHQLFVCADEIDILNSF